MSKDVTVLIKALEFYAHNEGNFEYDGAAHSGGKLKIRDRGERARIALDEYHGTNPYNITEDSDEQEVPETGRPGPKI